MPVSVAAGGLEYDGSKLRNDPSPAEADLAEEPDERSARADIDIGTEDDADTEDEETDASDASANPMAGSTARGAAHPHAETAR